MRVCPHLTSVTSVRTWMGRWRVCVCVLRVVEFVTRKGYSVVRTVTEVGSGLNTDTAPSS